MKEFIREKSCYQYVKIKHFRFFDLLSQYGQSFDFSVWVEWAWEESMKIDDLERMLQLRFLAGYLWEHQTGEYRYWDFPESKQKIL